MCDSIGPAGFGMAGNIRKKMVRMPAADGARDPRETA
jgi:hypothetical protein